MSNFRPSSATAPTLSRLLTRLQRWIVDAHSRGSIAPFLCLYAPFAWLILLLLPTRPPTVSLDHSWATILHYGAEHHWQYGVDALFTYGPLGYLHCTAQYIHGTYLSCIAYQLIFKAFYVGLVCRLATRLPRGSALILVLVNTILPMVDDDSIYLLTGGYTALLACEGTAEEKYWRWLSLAFLAVATLIKGTFLVYAGVILLGVGAYLIINRRTWQAGRMAAVFGVCFLVAYTWVASQNLLLLGGFLRLMKDVVGGYPAAMSLDSPPEGMLGGGLVLGCVLGRLAWLTRRTNSPTGQRATLVLILGTGLFLAWKAGFTRGDVAHQPTFFAYALSLAAAAPIFFPTGAQASEEAETSFLQAIQVLAPALAVWTLCVQQHSGNHYPPFDRVSANLGWLLVPQEQKERMEVLEKYKEAEFRLPECRAVIGRGSVDMYGCHQGVVLVNGFNYRPAPVFHGYNAYTPRLVKLNTAYYQSDHAPEFVLFKPFTIDGRFPTLDNGGVLLELLRHYQPVLMERGILLLKRQQAGLALPQPTATPLASGQCQPGEKITLPKSAGAIWCQIDVHLNLLGRLVGFFYRGPAVKMVSFSLDGTQKPVNRLVPGMASEGFLVTPLVSSAQEFVALQSGHPSEAQQVSAIGVTFEPEWMMDSHVEYRFYGIQPFRLLPAQ